MYDLFVRDIVRVGNGKLLCGDLDLKLGKICTDTRVLQKGDVYVGLMGEVVNGSDFYQEAILKGASVCILNYDVPSDSQCSIVVVDDTLKCLQELAKYKRSLMDIPVVAVTGSVGKTSTKDMVASVISTKASVHKTEGNYNNHIGVPLTILSYRDEDVLVVEMGMNHLGEISLLSHIARPTISIITNVGTAHIGNLGSRENILKAKLEILDGMVGKDVVINVDNDMLSSVYLDLKEKYDVRAISIDGDSDYKAINLREDVFESIFDIENISRDICVSVGGKAFIYNSLIAYAVGNILGIDDKDIKRGIKEFQLTGRRLDKKVNRLGTVVIDGSYNANYDSMKSSLELLGNVRDKRKVAILGDMLELGEYSHDIHKNIGDVVVENHVDVLITVGKESVEIDNRAMELGMRKEDIFHFEREGDTYSFLKNFIKESDIVLVKGSLGMHLVNVVNEIMNI